MELISMIDLVRVAAVAPVVLILLQVAKGFPKIAEATRWLPLLAIAIAFLIDGLSILGRLPESMWYQTIAVWAIESILIGLSASGLWDLTKKTVLNK